MEVHGPSHRVDYLILIIHIQSVDNQEQNPKADIFQYDLNFCLPPGFQVLGKYPSIHAALAFLLVSCAYPSNVCGAHQMENLGFCLRFLAQGCISFPELTWLALALRSCLTPASPKDWILFSVLQLFGLDRSEYKKCLESQCCHLSEFPTPSGGWNLHC